MEYVKIVSHHEAHEAHEEFKIDMADFVRQRKMAKMLLDFGERV